VVESENYANSDRKCKVLYIGDFMVISGLFQPLCILCVGFEETGTENVKCRSLSM
jgi:hypothetical protein